MNRDEGLATALFAIVMGGAVALAVVNDITAPACRAAQRALNGTKDFDFGCLEFWLNRYQTTFAALIGASVALYVVRPVFQQLREMARQSAVAMRSAYRDHLTSIESEAEQYMTIARRIHASEKMLTGTSTWQTLSQQDIDAEIISLEELKILADKASLIQLITESAQVRSPENLFAMLYAYINKAREALKGGRIGDRSNWRSCYPIVDGKTVDLRSKFHELAVALQPQIRQARRDLAEVEARMR